MIYDLFIAGGIVAFLIIGGYAVWEIIADRWAAYQDGAREAVSFDDLRALPETTAFDPPANLPRERLREVPVQGARLHAVPPPTESDEWAELLRQTDPARMIPEQRDGSAS